MKIVKLDIDENSILAGIDAVALVEQPAIEEDFMYFSKQEFADTFTDYPEAAVEAAKQGIKRNEALGNPCATQVGKVRAQQLANREPVSLDTVRRMRSFLIRQKDNYELAQSRRDYDACGYISYLLWGGPAALPWTEKVLRQAGEEFEGLEDACWPGYEAIGTKIKDGREVPNCVPKANFNKFLFEEIVKNELFEKLYDTKEEAEKAAIELGCEGAHQMGDKWMPCSSHQMAVETQGLGDYINELPEDTIDAIIAKLDEVGEEMSGWVEMDKDEFYKEAFATITSSPNKPSTADFGNLAVRYRYTGPIDDRNRKFCSRVMRLGKVFRKEDINALSIEGANEEFGTYDIFRYKGSYNCRHYWEEVFYKRENTVSNDKKPLAISNRILDATTINPPITQGTIPQGFAALDEKQMLVGPLMVPNKLIIRKDEEGNPYYVYFTEETIKKLAYKMMKDKLIDSVNIEHNSADKVEDAYLVETWLVEDPKTDKSRKYGFEPVKGQWMGMYKIDNKKIWDEYVKTGKVKGFSVEGFFEQYAMSKTKCIKNRSCACGMSQHPAGLCDGSHLKN